MNISRAAIAAKTARKEADITQLEMTFNGYFGSQESVSHQEIGRYKVQPELSKYYVDKYNDPFVALEASAEYIGWGPQKLDGEAVDLHRSTVSIKIVEELKEALEAIDKAKKKITSNPDLVSDLDKQIIEESLQETIDVITAANHYVAVICKEYRISWVKMWTQHRLKLIQKRFLKN